MSANIHSGRRQISVRRPVDETTRLQVLLPFIGRPIVPSRFGQRFAAGQVVEGGRQLFVSTGLGTSILPIRFRVPPSVAMLTIVSEQSESGDSGRPDDVH